MSHTEKVAGVMVGEACGSRNSPQTLNTPESHLQAPLPTCSHLSSDHPQPGTSHHQNAHLHLGIWPMQGPLTSWGLLPVGVGEVTPARQK